ncbi:MAG: 4-(cytidine 5'-diphospho)-2-C-methyl-D-erythritol kinase [Ruminococcus sp.]|nr:4-(cytidine 5'-diphospho)-2-C-methyl-D-erythritol kinase [Ruminococcus sp.]
MDNLTVKAYGKLNLYLDVTGKREDGYHLLRSVMQSVSVHDTLSFEISDGEGIELICDAPGFPRDESNLIWKAAELFYKELGTDQNGKLTVTIDKQIPSMAGMAGGSADGAAALKAINALNGYPFSDEMLLGLAAKLGADVPFTMSGGTVLCEGIGEKMKKLDDIGNIYFAVIRPDVSISTPQAYKAYDSRPLMRKKSYAAFSQAMMIGDAQGIADAMFNALEAAVNEPEIRSAKEKLIAGGALGAMMTGSGSAVFGVFDDKTKARLCVDRLDVYPFAQVLEPVRFGIEIMR